jgi:hypothetical protein
MLDFSFCGNALGIEAMLKAVFGREPGGETVRLSILLMFSLSCIIYRE